jgi:hypothetical protein
MFRIMSPKSGEKRGAVLPVTIILCVLAAMTTVWLIGTLVDQQRINNRRRDVAKAYFAAEAGVELVKHWGNFPEEFDNSGVNGLFYRKAQDGTFPNLTATLAAAGPDQGYPIPEEKLAALTSKYNYEVSSIQSIVLLPPAADDPVACLFKVRSVGDTPSGRTRTVLAYLTATPFKHTDVKLAAGLISLGVAGQAGNGRVHWGESWSRGDFDMLTRPQSLYLSKADSDYDPFAKYRTEGNLLFPSSWNVFDPSRPKKIGDVHTVETERFPGSLGGVPAKTTGNYVDSLEQLIPPGEIEWPDFLAKYNEFKALALSHGRYFGTDASGNIYRDGIEKVENIISFDAEFGDANRETSPYDIIFIDTVDGNPPAANGSNLATISNSGQNQGMKGIFYICANYAQGGSGKPAPLLNAEKPIMNLDGTVTYQLTTLPGPEANSFGVYLDGVMYAAGTMSFQGNPVVYGSLVAEKGYGSGGTPEIYYNHKLKDGLQIPQGNIGSTFATVMQKNY